MPAVSVLIPCFNVERYVRECLDSVVNQTLGDLEILCINDGSTDATPDILREYAARDARIRIIDKPNSGYGDSMNRGLDAASGEYIGIVESDDRAEPDMFETLYSLAETIDCDLVKGNFYSMRGGVSTPGNLIAQNDAGFLMRPSQRSSVFAVPDYIWTAVYRRSWLNECGIRFLPTPGASYQDTSFNFKALSLARRALFTHKPLLHYRRDNELSSVHSTGKVFCVCDEYREIERFLQEHPELSHLVPVAQKMKYQSYFWNFRRLAPPANRQFGVLAAAQFAEAFRLGLIRRDLFRPKHYRRLRLWARMPRLFFALESLRAARKKLSAALRGRS